MRFTLDSNILVCAADGRDTRRRDSAIAIIGGANLGDCLLTPQSLAEFFHVVTRKRLIPRPDAAGQVRRWAALFPITQGADAAAVLTAVEAATTGRFQFYDALLIVTAAAAGCHAMISEDMAAGTELAGLRIVPAFTATGDVAPAAQALLGTAPATDAPGRG
ncbi:MAG: PIN domain-containing protein [Proteobacteria bacterium]|nr:PIN domain-containing protein [Pseudomonadota bacterium]